MYHIFFIHSSDNGHSGCFCVLAIVNSAAVNIGGGVSFWIMEQINAQGQTDWKAELTKSEMLECRWTSADWFLQGMGDARQ